MPKNLFGSGEIRTRASEETGALNQRLRPLGHATPMLSSDPFGHHTSQLIVHMKQRPS